MKKFKGWMFVLAVLLLTMLFAGCSKPPEAEREAAKKAMDAATSAGAEKYAAADFDAAKKKWDAAESQMKEKMYKEAKQSYIEVKAAFEKAAAAVEAGKKAMVDQTKTALQTLEGAWKKLEADTKKMEKMLKEKKAAWATDAKAIKEGLDKAKEMIAASPAEAKTKLEELKGLIGKWENTLKEMATAATKPKATKPKK
jgi:PBP1b-binding outer membrane lipoprotein LpoB